MNTRMIRIKNLPLIAALAVLMIFSPLSSEAAFITRKDTLENGMTVLVTEMPENPMVSVYALVKAGSATEGKYLGSGITHYLEHMLFKETENREVGEISETIQSVGGSINAATSRDYTIYTITVPKESFQVALDVLADMLMNTIFSEAELEKERDVVLKEMILHEDNLDRQLIQKVYQSVYLTHPYQHPIIGYRPTFLQLDKDDLEDYFQTYYRPNNIIFSIAGNVDEEEAFASVRKAFVDFQRKTEISRHISPEADQIAPRFVEFQAPSKVTRAALAYRSVKLLDKDLYALDVLAMILGQGRSSRLLREFYHDQKLVYNISAWNYTPYDEGMFVVNFLSDDQNVEKVIQGIKKEIEMIKKKGVGSDEIKDAKKNVLSDYLMSKQTTGEVARSQAVNEAIAGHHDFDTDYLNGIRAVTKDDITSVASEYLNENSLTTVVMHPPRENEMIQGDSESSHQSIEKVTLPNGITVLLKENTTFPIATARVFFLGGLREETEEINGVSKMLSSLLLRGTKKRDVHEINEFADSYGMSLGSYSGRNSVGISLDFLKEDTSRAMDLLYDLVAHSTFPETEIIKVKDDMRAAIRQRDDNIFQYSIHHLLTHLYPDHPFRFDQNGSFESLEKISRKNLIEFYDHVLSPQNLVVTIFGDIDASSIKENLEKSFAKIKGQDNKVARFDIEPIRQTREVVERLDKEQAMVLFGFHGIDVDHKDKTGLEVLSGILGSSFSGRLFTRIRDQLGKAYTLGGSSVPSLDQGFIYFYALTSPENAEDVKSLMIEEIQRLQAEKVPTQELENMRQYLIGRFKSGLQTNSDVSFTVGLDELYDLGYKNYLDYQERVHAVTPADLQNLARKYLDIDKAVIQLTLPKDMED